MTLKTTDPCGILISHAALAQLVEHRLGKTEVTGSSPVGGSQKGANMVTRTPYPVLDVVTESGSVYRIDLERRFWIKFSRHGYTEPIERITDLQVGDELVTLWSKPEAWKSAHLPVLGKHMYIASRDVWWVSLPVVRLVETTSDAPVSTKEA